MRAILAVFTILILLVALPTQYDLRQSGKALVLSPRSSGSADLRNSQPILPLHNENQFWGLYGIAVRSGIIYLVDSGNNRIQKFDSSGNFIKKWGSLGNGDGQFRSPEGIAIDSSGNVYVTESGNSRIEVFDSSGNFIKKWGSYGNGTGQFRSPEGIAIDSSGNVYVVDSGNNRIQKFDSSGNFIKKWGSSCGLPPLYFGQCVSSRGPLSIGDGQFMQPYYVALDSSGHVFVTDSFNNRIEVFDSSGNFIKKWGSYGNGTGQFRSPEGIAIDSSGNVYVVDSGNNRIQKFDSSGNFIKKWGSSCFIQSGIVRGGVCLDPDGPGPLSLGDGQFMYPHAIALDSSGHVFVTDNFNNRIEQFDSSGNFIKKWVSGGEQNLQPQLIAQQLPLSQRETTRDWHFVAAGDWGSDPETYKTVYNIDAKIKNATLITALGDYSYYHTGESTPIQQWWNIIMKPLESRFKAILGDHDVLFSDSYKKLFGVNNWYYSFDYRSIHFISIDTQENLLPGSPQYNFVKSDLQKAEKDPNIIWVIPLMHRPMYSAKSPMGPKLRIGSYYSERYDLHPLFDNYSKIALVLNGHSHNYERTYPILYSNESIPVYPFRHLEAPVVTSTNLHEYLNPKGQIYVTVGTAGSPNFMNDDNPPYICIQNQTYGFLDIEVKNNNNTLVGKFYSNDEQQNGKYLDYFTITKY